MQLEQVLARGALSHAYLICGRAGAQRRAAAGRMAAALVCTGETPPCGACPGCRKAESGIHPDVLWHGEGALSVAEMRALRADAYIRPNEAARKVYLIDGADGLNASAQNALLKLLEEGPAYAAFLLLAEHEGALLPTIRSRCQVLRLSPALQEEPAYTDEVRAAARTLADLLEEREELALLAFSVSLEKWDREALNALWTLTRQHLRDRLVEQRSGEGARALLSQMALLERLRRAGEFHVGAGHLSGWLCAGAASILEGGTKEN